MTASLHLYHRPRRVAIFTQNGWRREFYRSYEPVLDRVQAHLRFTLPGCAFRIASDNPAPKPFVIVVRWSDGPAIRGNDRPVFGRGTPAIHLNSRSPLGCWSFFRALIKPRKQTARCFAYRLCLPFIAVVHAWNLAKERSENVGEPVGEIRNVQR